MKASIGALLATGVETGLKISFKISLKRGLATGVIACLAFTAGQARAESVIAGQCSALGDLSEQIVGWKNRGKTEAQAIAQTRKYYQDEADRKALATVVDEIYGDTRKKLIPEQVSMRITSECATAMQQGQKPQ